VRGKRVADLCAAPGGKAAQLAAAGAQVVAVDRSPARMERLRQNLERLRLEAETVVADAAEWQAPPFDAVLLDAPCSSTGTIRRHPDVPWLKQESDIVALTALQRRLIRNAIQLTKPGGVLVYCTCSLEPEEGIDVVAEALASEPGLRRRGIASSEIDGLDALVTADGDLRTLPCQLSDPDPRYGGLDGFFAARLERI
jgi:16S rRNA (cytosine967-C5)-methyltransferase